ncbi:MAG: hypothetical protein MHM6MM_006154 [Cercozoa sp. M6MM]
MRSNIILPNLDSRFCAQVARDGFQQGKTQGGEKALNEGAQVGEQYGREIGFFFGVVAATEALLESGRLSFPEAHERKLRKSLARFAQKLAEMHLSLDKATTQLQRLQLLRAKYAHLCSLLKLKEVPSTPQEARVSASRSQSQDDEADLFSVNF